MGWISEINNEQRRLIVGMFGAQVLGGLLRDAFLSISCSALQPWPQTPADLLASSLVLLPAGFLAWETLARDWRVEAREKPGVSHSLSWAAILAVDASTVTVAPTK